MKDNRNGFFKELVKEIKSNKSLNKDKLSKLKNKLCEKYGIAQPPTDIEIFLNTPTKDVAFVKKLLQTKPVRTLSGVAVVAIMTKPIKCPHGKCTYCPGGPKSHFGNIPQSYTGKEPATMRAIRCNFDPYVQVMSRLEQYIVSGHNPEKIELIIMGGTFPSFDKKYQENFVTYALKAMNDFSKLFYRADFDLVKFKKFFMLPGDIYDKKREKEIQKRLVNLRKEEKTTLEKEQKRNENSRIKCIGMTVETRPDFGKLGQGNEMLRLGATRIELGVQTVYDDVLQKIERGHTVEDTIESTRVLRDLGFKINYHIMPGLPGVSKEKDIYGFRVLFSNPDFRPDMLKIYPCMVLKGTKLYAEWKKGTYRPLTTEEAADIISEFKRYVPNYVRIMRVQRDIPPPVTEAGVDRSNLRQYVKEALKQKRIWCSCIRCREPKGREISKKVEIRYQKYDASLGFEYFIFAEDVENKYVLGFCRLRLPSQELREEITRKSALVRELHVYGVAAGIGETGDIQHKGIGKKLLERAEELAKHEGKNKVVVISGIGARPYYAKLGYKRQGPYMVKRI